MMRHAFERRAADGATPQGGRRPRGALARLRRGIAGAGAALLVYMVAAAPASAMQVLEAADHAELRAEVSGRAVSRIALEHDRIERVVRGPDGFEVEHDPASGDLYLRPLDAGAVDTGAWPAEPVTLFLGTEKGFTYRLALTVAERGSAQILIRNAGAAAGTSAGANAPAGDPRVAALVRLVRAVARREPLPGFRVGAGPGRTPGGLAVVETWRGAAFTAQVVEAGAGTDAAALAARGGPGVAAAWVAAPGTGPGGGRLGVVVHERAPARGPGRAEAGR